MALEDLFREEDIEEIEKSFAKIDREMEATAAHRTNGFRDWLEQFDDEN